MKYVLMYTSRPELEAAVSPEEAEAVYKLVYQWFMENGDKFSDGGAELHPVTTATTVKSGDESTGGAPVVVDGPFNEAKEIIGGFSVIDVPDMDAAIALVKTWPRLALPGVAIEIRPMVTDYSQLEE